MSPGRADLTGSFGPDGDYEFVTTKSGSEASLRVLVREGVARFADVIGTLARDTSEKATQRLAEEVLEILAQPRVHHP